MEDSNIYYYVILGVIYVISRVLKKKNQPEESIPEEASIPDSQQSAVPKRPTSIEELLKEINQQMTPEIVVKQPETKPQYAEQRNVEPKYVQPKYEQPKYIDYQKHNIEEIKADEYIDIVPHKQIQRDKPVFQRSSNFQLEEEENHVLDGVHEILDDEEGPKKALILKEIFDRRF